MSDELFYLKWNNFQRNVRRMRDEAELVDITFACEGKKIGAHKLVLFACSPFFKDLLKENSSSHPIFYMNDVKFEILKAILEYMYLGEVHITNDNLKDFIKTAESLQIRGLSKDTNANDENPVGQDITDLNLEDDFGRKRQNVNELGQISTYGSNKKVRISDLMPDEEDELGEEEEEDDMMEEIQMPRSRKSELSRSTHQTLQIIDQQNVEPKVEMLDYLEEHKAQQSQIQTQHQHPIQQTITQNQQLQYCNLDSFTAATDKGANNRLQTGNEPNTTPFIQAGTSQQNLVQEYKTEQGEVWIEKATMEIGSGNTSQSETSPKSTKSKGSNNKANCLTPRSCPVCARVYSNVSNLRQHMRLIHNPTAVVCPICQKHFNSDLYLKRHYASIHAINTTSGSENSTEVENKSNIPTNNATWTYAATTNNDANLIQQ